MISMMARRVHHRFCSRRFFFLCTCCVTEEASSMDGGKKVPPYAAYRTFRRVRTSLDRSLLPLGTGPWWSRRRRRWPSMRRPRPQRRPCEWSGGRSACRSGRRISQTTDRRRGRPADTFSFPDTVVVGLVDRERMEETHCAIHSAAAARDA